MDGGHAVHPAGGDRPSGAEVVAHYVTPPAEVRAVGLAVTGVGRIRGKSGSHVHRALPGYAGVWVTEGTGRLALRGGAQLEVGAGRFFWLPPGVPHTYGPSPGTWSEFWVLFEGPATARYEDIGLLAAGPAPVRPADSDGVSESFTRLLDLAGQVESLRHHVVLAAALHTLIAAVGAPRTERAQGPAGTRGIGGRALEILARDAEGPVSIAAVARELSVSRDTLATEVRRLTGSTPTDYLTRLRLTRAQGLLADTGRSVAEVARAVGYDDAAYFSRVFKRRIGVAPTAFRRQQRRSREEG